jgi:hypothetical protein
MWITTSLAPVALEEIVINRVTRELPVGQGSVRNVGLGDEDARYGTGLCSAIAHAAGAEDACR